MMALGQDFHGSIPCFMHLLKNSIFACRNSEKVEKKENFLKFVFYLVQHTLCIMSIVHFTLCNVCIMHSLLYTVYYAVYSAFCTVLDGICT